MVDGKRKTKASSATRASGELSLRWAASKTQDGASRTATEKKENQC